MACKELLSILAGMRPAVRAWHSNRWVITTGYKDVLPPRNAEELYREYCRRKCHAK